MPKLLRSTEIALWSVGAVCAVILIADRVEVTAAQRTAAVIGTSAPARTAGSAERDDSSRAVSATDSLSHGIMGRLEIPALHLSTPIVDNTDLDSLRRGAGHIPGTALPGGLGNFVVAAHRDTFFRPLSRVKPGMHIRVVTPDETYTYHVDATAIVSPNDVDVLDMGDVPQMTLITCYPFHYIGAAPQRFTVKAHLISF